MSWKHLGEAFDIHGGGIDLVFPHHENEIAQTRCAFHSPVMANFWMHNGFLQVEGEKMAKSVGNFVTIRDLFRGQMGRPVSGGVARLAMLRTHYRQPIDWTVQSLSEANLELGQWALIISSITGLDRQVAKPIPSKELLEALCDDLNTAEALTVLRQQFNQVLRHETGVAEQFVGNLLFLGMLDTAKLNAYAPGVSSAGVVSIRKMMDNAQLGEALKVAFLNDDEAFKIETEKKLAARNLKAELVSGIVRLSAIDESLEAEDDEIEKMIAARNEARRAKNFAESDRIRDELAAMGVVLKDSKDGTTWEIAR
jgi:cysteinyl-tRNA synthetase